MFNHEMQKITWPQQYNEKHCIAYTPALSNEQDRFKSRRGVSHGSPGYRVASLVCVLYSVMVVLHDLCYNCWSSLICHRLYSVVTVDKWVYEWLMRCASNKREVLGCMWTDVYVFCIVRSSKRRSAFLFLQCLRTLRTRRYVIVIWYVSYQSFSGTSNLRVICRDRQPRQYWEVRIYVYFIAEVVPRAEEQHLCVRVCSDGWT
jgi:hypothetical protein